VLDSGHPARLGRLRASVALSGVLARSEALRVIVALLLALAVAACDDAPDVSPEVVRPVRAVQVELREAARPVVLSGTIRASDEVSLAFRIGGRLIERAVDNGDVVTPGQFIGRLEAQNELNLLRSAEAGLAAAQAQLTEARNNYGRQATLLERGFAARAVYDAARRNLETAEAQLEAAMAQVRFAEDQVAFTELYADAEGVVTAIGAEPGEVVQAGQMVVQLARAGGRDAVFDVPAQVLRTAPQDPEIDVFLTEDPAIRAAGRVREVAPQADPLTRTFEVKVGLSNPPPQMRLGATVTGRMEVAQGAILEIPAAALTRASDQPAVWVIDPETMTVGLRPVVVAQFKPASVVIAEGLQPGDTVVTAGAQALRPGQKVRVLGAET
jgi:RND family efflux transporter MFP subunit